MRRTNSLTTGVLTMSILLAPVVSVATAADAPPASQGGTVFFEKQLDSSAPDAVLADLWKIQRKQPLTFAQQMDMGIALVLSSKSEQAAGAESRLGQTMACCGRDGQSCRPVGASFQVDCCPAVYLLENGGGCPGAEGRG